MLVLLGAVVTGYDPNGLEVAGVFAVAAGVVLVRGLQGGDRLGVALGLLIAAQIAAYTLVDAEGIQDANPVPYLLFALLPAAVGAALLSGRERLRAEWRAPARPAAAAPRLRARARRAAARARRARRRSA